MASKLLRLKEYIQRKVEAKVEFEVKSHSSFGAPRVETHTQREIGKRLLDYYYLWVSSCKFVLVFCCFSAVLPFRWIGIGSWTQRQSGLSMRHWKCDGAIIAISDKLCLLPQMIWIWNILIVLFYQLISISVGIYSFCLIYFIWLCRVHIGSIWISKKQRILSP